MVSHSFQGNEFEILAGKASAEQVAVGRRAAVQKYPDLDAQISQRPAERLQTNFRHPIFVVAEGQACGSLGNLGINPVGNGDVIISSGFSIICHLYVMEAEALLFYNCASLTAVPPVQRGQPHFDFWAMT